MFQVSDFSGLWLSGFYLLGFWLLGYQASDFAGFQHFRLPTLWVADWKSNSTKILSHSNFESGWKWPKNIRDIVLSKTDVVSTIPWSKCIKNFQFTVQSMETSNFARPPCHRKCSNGSIFFSARNYMDRASAHTSKIQRQILYVRGGGQVSSSGNFQIYTFLDLQISTSTWGGNPEVDFLVLQRTKVIWK